MTYPDLNINRAGADPETHENVQDVIPPTARGQDPERTDAEEGLTFDGSRPLTDEERKAADRDAPLAARVYAPASERVPKEPVPGHRDFIQHTDTHTPEREAVTQMPESSSEPTFARVSRPSVTPSFETPVTGRERRRTMFIGMGASWFTAVCCGVGAWLFMRRRQERNKPINRLRRQALQAASEIRDLVPRKKEALQPAMGLTAAMLSALVVLWRQAQFRSRSATRSGRQRAAKATRHASHAVSDVDWQKRLMTLKERWDPRRLELEKISISRH
jgi:hypothetical protein